jgi:hypothetical protein
VIRGEIRELLLDTDSSNPFWSNELLLQLFNDQMDLRTMDLALSTEGWIIDVFSDNIVADQETYTVKEGCGQVLRVSIKKTVGTVTKETRLVRDEEWGGSRTTDTAVNWEGGYPAPNYRLQGNLIKLRPPIPEAITGGLTYEGVSMQTRLTADQSTVSVLFPSVLETLLKYDTVVAAFRVEGAQDAGTNPQILQPEMIVEQARFEARWLLFLEGRQQARVFTDPVDYGD